MYETASKRVYKSKRCVLFMTFRPSQRTLFMARRNWVPLALKLEFILHQHVKTLLYSKRNYNNNENLLLYFGLQINFLGNVKNA